MEHKLFDDINRTVYHNTLLAHPYFNKLFDIHIDAIVYQLGAVITQDGKPIAFYIRKRTKAQTRYTVAATE